MAIEALFHNPSNAKNLPAVGYSMYIFRLPHSTVEASTPLKRPGVEVGDVNVEWSAKKKKKKI
jgi:hypothetical protein